ncbi:MAG TPA: hypothetical protein DEA08_38035, partial [Planctomycetes bacterium]|nr:hypothetical protein [Planctomycetota bacterium]
AEPTKAPEHQRPQEQGPDVDVSKRPTTGKGRVVEVRARGGEGRLRVREVPLEQIEAQLKALEGQRVPERYRQIVRDYFSRWERTPGR